MIYKHIILNGEQTYFRIYTSGQVMSEKTGKYYKGTIAQGYRWFDLRFNHQKIRKSQHRLLAEAFLENPLNLPCVHHKDGNRLNNDLNNLAWVSESENNLGVNRHCREQHISEPVITGEQWRNYLNTCYSISTFGRVRNNVTHKIMKGKITDSGYRQYCLTINKQKISKLAHRLVWECWYNETPLIINHIDGNKLNNNINNLENVTTRQNNIKAIYETKTHKFQRTAQYDTEGNLIRIYENNADAARHMHVKPQTIQQAIKNHYCSCGFYWSNIQE